MLKHHTRKVSGLFLWPNDSNQMKLLLSTGLAKENRLLLVGN